MKIEWFKPDRRFKTGSTVMATIAVVMALTVGVNMLVKALPQSMTQIDITSSGLYTLSESTQTVVDNLNQPIEIYYLVQDGYQDSAVETLLNRYKEKSDNISWQIKDPALNPTFAQNYDNAAEGSVIVTCGEKYQVLDSYDLYQYNYDYNTGGYTTSFDAENQITSALRYVSSEETPKVYLLKGHNETEIPSGISEQMKQQNLTTEELNLLNYDAVPEDAAAVMIISPQKDLTEHETELLRTYLAGGGHIMLFSQINSVQFPNLDTLLGEYGMQRTNGLAVELDTSKIYAGLPTVLLPTITQGNLTSGVDTDGYILTEYCEGIIEVSEMPENVSVTKILTTSSNSHSKTNWQQMESWDYEEGDVQGPLSVGLYGSKTENEVESGIVWFSSMSLLDENADAVVNGNNSALVLSALAEIAGQEVESLGIAAKSLDTQYLVMSAQDAGRWNMICMYVIPFAALIIGIAITVKRRKA